MLSRPCGWVEPCVPHHGTRLLTHILACRITARAYLLPSLRGAERAVAIQKKYQSRVVFYWVAARPPVARNDRLSVERPILYRPCKQLEQCVQHKGARIFTPVLASTRKGAWQSSHAHTFTTVLARRGTRRGNPEKISNTRCFSLGCRATCGRSQ